MPESGEGARDIIAEKISDEPKLRRSLRTAVPAEGIIVASARNTAGDSAYEMYYDYREPCSKVQPHRILAMNRGEKEEFLSIKIELPEEKTLPRLQNFYIKASFVPNAKEQLNQAIKDAWKRLLFPSLEREIRSELTQRAEEQALKIFRENLRSLLMLPPVQGKRILAIVQVVLPQIHVKVAVPLHMKKDAPALS